MFSNKMDFSSCVIWIDFYKSGHIYVIYWPCRPCSAPWWFDKDGRKLPVKADLAWSSIVICLVFLGSARVGLMFSIKLNFSSCTIWIGFTNPDRHTNTHTKAHTNTHKRTQMHTQTHIHTQKHKRTHTHIYTCTMYK